MRRVVVTGMGIVSCLGNDLDTVSSALAEGRSGIRAAPSYAEFGLRSQIAGRPEIALDQHLDRRDLRFMGDAAAYAAIALKQAIADSGLSELESSHPRTGLIAGSGGASSANIVEAADLLRQRGIRKVGATRVPRTMSSTVAACLATTFHIKGVSYSITSACATSAHCIGSAAEQIRWGNQDVMFCGGGEEEHWSLAALFDAMGALSSARNATPESASRAYDANRDGFVIAGGGGMLVLESFEHARARGAGRIRSDRRRRGHGSAVGRRRGALHAPGTGVGERLIDYLNAHGTSTTVGDAIELKAVREVSRMRRSCFRLSELAR